MLQLTVSDDASIHGHPFEARRMARRQRPHLLPRLTLSNRSARLCSLPSAFTLVSLSARRPPPPGHSLILDLTNAVPTICCIGLPFG